MKVCSEQFGHKVAVVCVSKYRHRMSGMNIHVFEGGDEDVAEANDLVFVSK